MTALTLRIAEDKHRRLKALARQRGVSINYLLDEAATLLLTEFDAETRFRLREQHLPNVAGSLYQFLSAHTGNYLVFFPSYGYMNQAVSLLEGIYSDRRAARPEKLLRSGPLRPRADVRPARRAL